MSGWSVYWTLDTSGHVQLQNQYRPVLTRALLSAVCRRRRRRRRRREMLAVGEANTQSPQHGRRVWFSVWRA